MSYILGFWIYNKLIKHHSIKYSTFIKLFCRFVRLPQKGIYPETMVLRNIDGCLWWMSRFIIDTIVIKSRQIDIRWKFYKILETRKSHISCTDLFIYFYIYFSSIYLFYLLILVLATNAYIVYTCRHNNIWILIL